VIVQSANLRIELQFNADDEAEHFVDRHC
jgi:hypothetical protein